MAIYDVFEIESALDIIMPDYLALGACYYS